ncbi:MAG: HAD hydrolase-like protein [Clostridia bacterium]|nr:HAD hydrolase-like protein [Clostridia bacterium]
MAYNKKPAMVLFDVGGTLFKGGNFSAVNGFEGVRQAAENPDVASAQALAELWDEYLKGAGRPKLEDGSLGEIPLSAAIGYATMKAGLRFNISVYEREELFDRYNSSRTVIDGVTELLATLKEQGIRTAVISNNMMSGESLALAMKYWIPSSEFEFCLTSADILYCKPSQRLFDCACAYAQLSPEACWYCGDSPVPDVDGANGAGLSPVLLDSASPVDKEIRSREQGGKYLAVNHWSALSQHIIEICNN